MKTLKKLTKKDIRKSIEVMSHVYFFLEGQAKFYKEAIKSMEKQLGEKAPKLVKSKKGVKANGRKK